MSGNCWHESIKRIARDNKPVGTKYSVQTPSGARYTLCQPQLQEQPEPKHGPNR